MKRRDLVRLLERNGWTFERHGSKHDIYQKGNDLESVPRHRDISEGLAKRIIKRWGLK
ncbi:MAG: type II toxin-antitoxin system HicA family toxin [Coriobacteriia bacterium]|nr:type II toxin-antitoxin system HicA family toxin [Coriobacteriia bacterium]